MKAQYAILRFAKYKGREISNIEAHNGCAKENDASNPDIDKSRNYLSFHQITPERKYRAEAERQIAEASCHTRSDSVRVMEAHVTAAPEFFKGKAAEIGAFLDKYIPAVEQVYTTLKKYNAAFTSTTAENKKLKKKTEQLEQSLDKATQESTLKKLADAKLHRDYEDAVAVLDRIPPEVLAAYTHRTEKGRETAYGR